MVAFDHTHPPRVPVHLQPTFDRIVRQSFATRRKTLRNNLKRALGEDTDPVLDAVNLDGRRRPETLSLDEFVALAMAVEERNTP